MSDETAPVLTVLRTLGGWQAEIETAQRGDESVALVGRVITPDSVVTVVWRRNGAARWLDNAYDLELSDVDDAIRAFATND